jgi:hypothetical protein
MARKKNSDVEISIDMDRKCSKCGDAGAMESGICMKCATEQIKPRIKTRMMLNKNNFQIGKLAPPKIDENTELSCVLICPDRTVVTNGQYVVEITGAECETNFLPFDDVQVEIDFEPFTMPADEAIALAGVFVKAETPDGNILAVQPENGQGTASFALRQARKEKVFRMDRPKSRFPNYEAMFNNVQNETAFVTLDLNLLIPILRHMKDISGGPVRIGIYGANVPVRFDCIDPLTNQSARALLMPMKE